MLVSLLVFTQAGALAHAYTHDPSTVQSKICATCIAAESLTSGCVQAVPQAESDAAGSVAGHDLSTAFSSVRIPLARQRAPPPL